MEQAFGVLKSRFGIIWGPSRVWNMDTIKNIMLTNIIFHSMIAEDERDTFNGNVDVDYDHVDNDISCYAYKRNSSTTSSRLGGGTYLRILQSQ